MTRLHGARQGMVVHLETGDKATCAYEKERRRQGPQSSRNRDGSPMKRSLHRRTRDYEAWP